ncbi:extradiol dioxygenase [Enterococcus saigonensis]|uniref:Extradiol dioxygenase n=1 Tax=Enterococcus saigonensis TaxID=1805431 RepID=A0A679I923_9ENTE|nr:VOC family protein [Enterococcus saigonensis]BCA84890.1 extradiol dioxygenase [Enterococcus saigonensis]
MAEFALAVAGLQTVALRVKNRNLMIQFYRDIIGFSLKREENELAIFGNTKAKSELLWLEESPYADDHAGEIKKLQRLCLVIPSEMEMADLAQRLLEADYPIKDALIDEEATGILVEDPEGNALEIYFGSKKVHQNPTSLQLDALARKATGEFPQLSDSVYFDKIHLNTSRLKEQQDFLENVIGLKVQDETNGILALNGGSFHVGLSAGKGGTLDLSTDGVLGLDFLQFRVSQSDITALAAHLEFLQVEFFIDQKRQIITIYDPTGIEWWFISEDKKRH